MNNNIKIQNNQLEITYDEEIFWDQRSLCGITNNYDFVENIRKCFHILPEATGTAPISKRQNKVLTRPFMISNYDTFFLYENSKDN